MKILHILHEPPFPPTSGIRCDMWRRLQAFRTLGHAVFAVTWASEAAGEMPGPAAMAAMQAATDELVILPIGRDPVSRALRIARLARHPSYIASRIPRRAVLEPLLARIRAFAPDLVWLEGVHPSWLALEVQRRLRIPLAYRSHNIEFRYVAEQARLARSPRLKLALMAGTLGLERAERALHRTADHVFDISADDLQWWQHQGDRNASWLAPQPDPAIVATAAVPSDGRDLPLLFVGSLSSPNNVAGLEWYLDHVLPLFPTGERPALTVAGRRPSARLAERLAAAGGTLIADPPDVAPLFARAQVMLNPILHGSGVNIKTIDMLATGRAVVTTPKGARGLPDTVTRELDIAERPEAFRDAVLAALARPAPADRGAMLERVFGTGAVAAALARMEIAA